MDIKHTPRPWRYEPGRNGQPPYVIRGNEGGFVVVGFSSERQEADARLIAAAPDLLDALFGLLYWDNGKSEWAAARAAIAKATGEQQ